MRWIRSRTALGALIIAFSCCLLAVTAAEAQTKKSAKQAESLEKTGDSTRAAVQKMMEQLRGMLAGYNSIIKGEAKDSQKAYKKLVGDLKSTEKSIEGVKKELASLKKEADRFFKDWEKDLESISNEDLRAKSASRREDALKEYASIGETLGQASEVLAPVMQDLNDQILYLGRDLSPEAIADLQDEAAALNERAEEASAKVRELVESAGKTQDEADAELESE
jgi:hypothetical protein